MPLVRLKGFIEGLAPAKLITRYNRAESHFGMRHIIFRFSRIDYTFADKNRAIYGADGFVRSSIFTPKEPRALSLGGSI